jgi:hemolysin activation/secretion protein
MGSYPRTARLAALSLLFLPHAALAQLPPGAGQQGSIIERQQQERLREQQERARDARPPREGIDASGLMPQVAAPDIGAGCHEIRKIQIDGATLLKDSEHAAIRRDFADRCLGSTEVGDLMAQLTKYYIDRGYITTRVYLPPQDLGNGTLQLTVVEGTIEAYTVDQVGRDPASLSVGGAFPGAPGDILNLRDLEQGLEQLNGLQSNHATMDIKPGTGPGQSIVALSNQTTSPAHLTVSYDNLGIPSTGRDNLSATASFDSLLGLNELIAFTRSQTILGSDAHKSDITAMQVSVPWGYNTFTLDASESHYTNVITLPSGLATPTTGRTTIYGLMLSRLLFRDQHSNLSLSGRVSTNDTDNYLGNQFLAVSSRRLATLDIGLGGMSRLGDGAFSGRIGYVQGLDAFGARTDMPDLPDDLPHAQFGKYTLSLGYQRLLAIEETRFQWNSQFNAQHSRDSLYGTQQFLVGSPASVRGAQLNVLSGDHGYAWRNDLALPWQAELAGTGVNGSVYVGYDIGGTSNRRDTERDGSMASATIGATVRTQLFSIDVFASRVVRKPAFMTLDEGTLCGVRLSLWL